MLNADGKLGRLATLGVSAGVILALAANASAEEMTPVDGRGGTRSGAEPLLKSPPAWAIGIEGYTGIGVLREPEGPRGHGLAGGLSRVRFRYLEAGVGLQTSDTTASGWRQVGGFLGAFVPFFNSVDVDATVGLARRTYLLADARYGAGGLNLSGPALTFRLGFSDRPSRGLLGLRLGAALFMDVDLKRHDAAWSYSLGPSYLVTGVTPVGGITTGVVVCIGMDVVLRRSRQH